MKGKPIRGRGFGGGLRYTFRLGEKAKHSEKQPRIVGGNMAGRTAEELTREFGAVRRLRPDIEQPVWHCPLSLTKGETITDETWDQVTRDLMIEMEFNPDIFPYVPVLHEEKHQHSHLWASRIGVDGSVWHGKWEAFKVIEACQRLEKKYGLVLTAGLHGKDDAAKANRKPRAADAPSILNANKVKGMRKVDTSENARVLLDCASRSSDLPTFTQAALAVGIAVKPNRSETTGRISGLSVIPPGRTKFLALGEATGKKLTWPRLLKIFEQKDQTAEAARLAARVVIDAADRRAVDRVEARLLRDGAQTAADTSKSKPEALVPSAATREAHAMARHLTNPNDQLGFLTEPPPPRPAGRIDDASLAGQTDAGTREQRERTERATAHEQIENELKSATKAQLKRLRAALTNELHAHDDAAIEQMLNRLLRLAVRVLTMNQVVLPISENERRVFAIRHTVQLVDAEVHRRADFEARTATVPEKARREPEPPTLRIVRAHDARQSPADRDRDAVARELDAKRERNRTS